MDNRQTVTWAVLSVMVTDITRNNHRTNHKCCLGISFRKHFLGKELGRGEGGGVMRKLQELPTKLKVKRHALPSPGYLSSKPLLEERFTLGVATKKQNWVAGGLSCKSSQGGSCIDSYKRGRAPGCDRWTWRQQLSSPPDKYLEIHKLPENSSWRAAPCLPTIPIGVQQKGSSQLTGNESARLDSVFI